jgi:tRNA (mo5U34)-methyltransferase
MSLTLDELRAEIAKHKWYHRIDLGDGIVTPGWAPIDPDIYQIPDDLTGKRVLDVGAWDGYWTFEALRRGASKVVAIDEFSDTGLPGRYDRGKRWATFDLCRKALGYNDGRCRRFQMSVYDVHTEFPNGFDVIFFFGTIYHCRHPMLALDRLHDVSRGDIYIESAICDDYSPYIGKIGDKQGHHGRIVCEFYPEDQYGMNDSNWWVPTLPCLHEMVRAAGWPKVEAWKIHDPKDVPYCRGFAWGRMGC